MFDTMTFTKVLGALCGSLLVFLLGKWAAEEIYQPGSASLEAAYVIDTGAEEPAGDDVAELTFDDALRVADSGAGERLWAQCRACHSVNEGQNAVGPSLYNVVGRPSESIAGFNYSGALPDGQEWTPEELSQFIHDPRSYAPGTTMAYAGMADVQDRANIIMYLVDHSPDYEMPELAAAEEPAAEAPVEEAPVEEAAVDEAAVEEAVAPEAPAADADSPLMQALAQADAEAGQQVFRQCQACHVADQEQNRVGPHLVGIVGREAHSIEGFRYSGNLPDGTWTVTELAAFLENPREYAPGTTMVFPGLADVQQQANVIAFIDSVGGSGEAVAAAAGGAAPAEEVPAEEAPAEVAPAEEAAAEEAPAADGGAAAALAQADAAAGQQVFRQCQACHVADQEQNRVGPHLVGVVGREAHAVEGFRYSGNLPDVTWTVDELSAFLANPREYAPGTTMVFPGIADEQQRLNVIAFVASVGGITEGAAAEAPAEEAPVAEEAAAPAGDSAVAQAVAAADPAAGQQVFRQCQACHVADQEQNRVGPHLVGIVGREANSVEGFRYSGNLPEGTWTLDELDAFLTNPRAYAPGTTMVYPGVSAPEQRANLLAFLQSAGQ